MSGKKEKVRSFIIENFLFGDDGGLEDHTSFLEEGIVDSTGIMELMLFLEKAFGIKVEDEEAVPENLDSLEFIEAYLDRKTA